MARKLIADRGGRVAPPAADPSQATGRLKMRDNQLYRARALEVRIHLPPPESPTNYRLLPDFITLGAVESVGSGRTPIRSFVLP